MMSRIQYTQWLQTNLNLPKMSNDEMNRRQKIEMEMEIMTCECVFYTGYRLPFEEWCDYCLGPKPNYKNVKVWVKKVLN